LVCVEPGTRSVVSRSRIRITSPHIGHSFAGIDFSLGGPYRNSSFMGWNTFRPFGGHALAVHGGEETRHDRRWFADEVVVDFPSVAPAVERMRSAFLADERAATMTAAIQLSRREAHEGATVPFAVPVRCTCHECGGRGETWAQPCTRCAGRGTELLHHQVHVTVPAGVEDGACFHFSVAPRHDLATRIELRVLVSPPTGG
jgi:uncharacterized protein (DUF1330 family)